MNTVKKGDLFEEKCLDIISKMLDNGDLIFLKENVRIFTKKKYPSIYRNDVQFDISIELWAPNAERYSMIYFIECKNYSSRIPVEKVQKFQNDIQQVSGVNAKGIFISNMPFQSGAYSHAEKIGMMVIQGDSSENFKIILHKRNGPVENRIQILKDSIDEILIDSGIETLEKIVDKQILESLSPNIEKVGYGIDLLDKKQITEIANQELNKINEDILIRGQGLDLKTITNYLSENYNIKLGTIPRTSNILGSCDIENKIIAINESIIGTQRHLFILCHEIGHYILHQNLAINQTTYDAFSDSERNFMTGKNNLENPRHWIEWQANYFSISFLLADTSIIAKLYHCQNRKNINKDPIYFNDQFENRKIVFDLINSLAYYFQVSKTSIIYRLTELNHFKDISRTKSVGQLINEYRKEYYT